MCCFRNPSAHEAALTTPKDVQETVNGLPSHLLPDSDLCRAALLYVAEAVPQAILNHSFRVYLIAKWFASREDYVLPARQDELLFVAAICHDLGTSKVYNGPQRFEVEGADAARAFLDSKGIPEHESQQVWTAIALHTSAGIAERIDSFTRLVRVSVLVDFVDEKRREVGAVEYGIETDRLVPRLNIEKVLGDAVVEQAVEQRSKAPPASWPGILLRAHLEDPEWRGVNRAF